jgi:hypothetical protein
MIRRASSRHPSHFTSLIHASAMYCRPQSQRIAGPSFISIESANTHPSSDSLELRPVLHGSMDREVRDVRDEPLGREQQ